MDESILRYVILLIPLAIFIGRIFAKARGKHQPPPKRPPQPYIPVHFEDDDYIDDEVEYSPSFGKTKAPVKKPEAALNIYKVPSLDIPVASVARNVTRGEAGFSQNINRLSQRLSPLQQAVVMSEILGPPKGMA